MTIQETIKAIEDLGYVVIESENRWLGKLNEKNPVVYEILKKDYSIIQGAKGMGVNGLANWLEMLTEEAAAMKTAVKETATIATATMTEVERIAKEKAFDNLYNEGAEGYNPYRA